MGWRTHVAQTPYNGATPMLCVTKCYLSLFVRVDIHYFKHLNGER